MWEMRLPRGHLLSLHPSQFLQLFLAASCSPSTLLFYISPLHPPPCLSSSPSIYLPAGSHPFNVLTAPEVTGLGYQKTIHTEAMCLYLFIYLLFSLWSVLACLYLWIFLKKNPRHQDELTKPLRTQKNTSNRNKPCVHGVLRGFYHGVLGSSPDVERLPGQVRQSGGGRHTHLEKIDLWWGKS